MRRRTTDEPVERLRPDRISAIVEEIRRKAARWAADHVEALRRLEPEPVVGLHDRAQDNWLPLLAIAEQCGSAWKEGARSAATDLSGIEDEDAAGVLLLRDLATVFEERSETALPTQELLDALHRMEDRPWSDFKRGRAISAPQLARILKGFDVRPRPFPGGKIRGYRLEDGLSEAFHRYVPALSSANPSQRHSEANSAGQLALSGEDRALHPTRDVTGSGAIPQPRDQRKQSLSDAVTPSQSNTGTPEEPEP